MFKFGLISDFVFYRSNMHLTLSSTHAIHPLFKLNAITPPKTDNFYCRILFCHSAFNLMKTVTAKQVRLASSLLIRIISAGFFISIHFHVSLTLTTDLPMNELLYQWNIIFEIGNEYRELSLHWCCLVNGNMVRKKGFYCARHRQYADNAFRSSPAYLNIRLGFRHHLA